MLPKFALQKTIFNCPGFKTYSRDRTTIPCPPVFESIADSPWLVVCSAKMLLQILTRRTEAFSFGREFLGIPDKPVWLLVTTAVCLCTAVYLCTHLVNSPASCCHPDCMTYEAFACLDFAGRKALQKTLQLCKDAEEMLAMYHLHVMCQSRWQLHKSTGLQYEKAQNKMDFHVRMAIEKGEASARPVWASLAVYAHGIKLQAAEVGSQFLINAKTMAATEEGQLLLEVAAANCRRPASWYSLAGLLQPVASTPTRSAACNQQPASAGPDSSSAASLQHQGTLACPPSVASPVANSATQVAADSPADMGKPAGAAAPAATAALQGSEASPADVQHSPSKNSSADQSTPGASPAALQADPDAAGRSRDPALEDPDACSRMIPLPKYLMEPPDSQQVSAQLMALGLPGFENKHPAECLLACQGPLTAPQPAFSPFNVRGSYSAREDPNLIIWNPGDNSAAWIDPEFHLNGPALAEIICHYSSARVLIEEDCDSDGNPANPSGRRSLLAELKIDPLPFFALAALNDIMAHQLRSDAVRQPQDAAGAQSIPGARRAEPASDVWSRRLVYLRGLDPDRLLGCVQVCMQPAARDVVGIAELFTRLTLRCDRFPKPELPAGWNGHARQSDVPAADRQPVSEPQPAALPTSQQLPSGPGPLMQTGSPRPRSAGHEMGSLSHPSPSHASGAPQQADSLSKAASEHSNTQNQVQDTPERPWQLITAVQAGNPDLAGKLREAQQQLEARCRLRGSSKADQDRLAQQLLEREKKDERNRRARAKLGKEPPPPKAPNASVEASGSNPAVASNPAADDDDDVDEAEPDPEAGDQSCDHENVDREREEEEEDDETKYVRLRAKFKPVERQMELSKQLERQKQLRERMETQAHANAAALLR